MSFLFGKKAPDPKEQARQWKRGLQHEMRGIDRQMRNIEREETKLKGEIKKAAKTGDMKVVKMMAQELVRSRKAKERMITAKYQINSVVMQIQTQQAQLRVAGALGKSAELMKGMNELIKIKEINAVAREMGKEMMKAELIEEIMDEAFEDDDLEEAADEEVAKVMDEVLAGQMDAMPRTGQAQVAAPAEQETAQDAAMDADLEARLAALQG